MIMFMGEYNHTVDAKGRLIVPSKFREQLGDEFVVTKGLDSCLYVFENKEWAALEEKLHALPLTNASARKITRFMLSGAVLCETDKQGRILIPSNLREYAGIEKDAFLLGMGSRIEIWSSARWDEEQKAEGNVDEIAGSLDGLGFGL